MIQRPKKGMRVRLHYKKRRGVVVPFNGRVGTVESVSKGPGPINVLVMFDGGDAAIVPRGNLVEVKA